MPKLIRIERESPLFFVYWKLTDFCNQACHYCPTFLHSGNYATGVLPGAMTNDEIIETCNTLNSIAGDKPGLLTISGGEPTVHDMTPEIISRLKDKFTIEIITNGSRALSWWKALPDLPHIISISLHAEYFDRTQSRINDLAKFLRENNVDVSFNLLCDYTNWDKVVEMYNFIDDEYKNLVVPTIITDIMRSNKTMPIPTADQSALVDTMLRSIKRKHQLPRAKFYYDDGSIKFANANEITDAGENRFKGWKCSAGKEGISIHFNGMVTAGICNAGPIGKAPKFKLKESDVICSKHDCNCTGDIILPKFKDQLVTII